MTEHIIVSLKANAHIEPIMSIWGWQIATYLFVGGLVAGVMVFSAIAVLARREDAVPFTAKRLPLVGLGLLIIGIAMVSLDVERKMMAWRFFTTFEVKSALSWGSWVLFLGFFVIALQALGYLRQGYPPLARLIEKIPMVGPTLISWVVDLSYAWRRPIAFVAFLFGVTLGVYTGILLSNLNARPLWHTAVLGPLFLTSGLSTAAALIILLAREPGERRLFTRIDFGLILLELGFIAVLFFSMLNGTAIQYRAIQHLLGGDYTRLFWVGFIGFGLVVPLLFELFSMRWHLAPVAVVTAVLVLGGGYLLRDIMLHAGQEVSWTHVENQFNPDLLKLLTSRTGTSHAE